MGVLHYKYIPKTGEWGLPDVAYPVITPSAGSHRKVIEELVGKGMISWNRARWEDLPTQYNVVNAFADLEVYENSGWHPDSIGGRQRFE